MGTRPPDEHTSGTPPRARYIGEGSSPTPPPTPATPHTSTRQQHRPPNGHDSTGPALHSYIGQDSGHAGPMMPPIFTPRRPDEGDSSTPPPRYIVI